MDAIMCLFLVPIVLPSLSKTYDVFPTTENSILVSNTIFKLQCSLPSYSSCPGTSACMESHWADAPILPMLFVDREWKNARYPVYFCIRHSYSEPLNFQRKCSAHFSGEQETRWAFRADVSTELEDKFQEFRTDTLTINTPRSVHLKKTSLKGNNNFFASQWAIGLTSHPMEVTLGSFLIHPKATKRKNRTHSPSFEGMGA